MDFRCRNRDVRPRPWSQISSSQISSSQVSPSQVSARSDLSQPVRPPGARCSGGVLGQVRGRLLGGAAGIALPAASLALALGVGLSTPAQAQTSSFNGTQATTYTLTTGTNTATFTFGPAA